MKINVIIGICEIVMGHCALNSGEPLRGVVCLILGSICVASVVEDFYKKLGK